MMVIKKLKIPDLLILKPDIYPDERGYFYESYNQLEFFKILGRKVNFVQDNYSHSKKNVLRGLHYQAAPFEQGKLVKVLLGEIWDVAVDIRKESKTYGSWHAEVLSSHNKKQFWIPEGFAHGFYVLSDVAEVEYKVNQHYSKDFERTIHWKNNPFEIEWPINNGNVILSTRDDIAK